MHLDEYKEFLYKNEPTEEMFMKYAVGNLDIISAALYEILSIKQSGKYQGVQVMNHLLIVFSNLDYLQKIYKMLNSDPNKSFYLGNLRSHLADKIIKKYSTVSSAKKYAKYEHTLKMEYTAILKE
jgi:hypothetical protein